MRGLLGLLSKEPSLTDCERSLFVATADPHLAENAFQRLASRFPGARMTVVAPEAYRMLFPERITFVANEKVKARAFWWTSRLRRERFDVAAFILSGARAFRLPKLWALLLNARSLMAYNENLASFSFHRNHWKTLYQHFVWRLTTRRLLPGQLLQRSLLPVGILILLAQTALLVWRRKPQGTR